MHKAAEEAYQARQALRSRSRPGEERGGADGSAFGHVFEDALGYPHGAFRLGAKPLSQVALGSEDIVLWDSAGLNGYPYVQNGALRPRGATKSPDYRVATVGMPRMRLVLMLSDAAPRSMGPRTAPFTRHT